MKSALVVFVFCAAAVLFYFNFEFENNAEIKRTTYKKSQPGPDLKPFEWAWLQRVYPYYDADLTAYKQAIEQTQLLKRSKNKLLKSVINKEWEFAGPVNIGGRVVDIEFNPKNPEIVYAGAATGGVFKSTDTGRNWFPIFDDLSMLSIGDIAVDPVNPEIIYAGTGEANGGHNNFPGSGIFKSTDAGKSWIFSGLESSASIGRIIVHPTNSNIVFAAAAGSYFSPTPQRGVYKSTNGGESWFQSLFVSDSTGAIDLIIDPDNPDNMMAAMWERVRRPRTSQLYGKSSGIYRTTDGGGSWTKLPASSGLFDSNTQNIGRIGLAISPSNPEVVYALCTNGNEYAGFYKSFNFGDSWTKADPEGQIGSGTSTFSWYFGQVRVHPTDFHKVYAMDVSFMRSTDGGATWPLNYGYSGPEHLHVDHHALAFHPDDPDYLINGNDGGINISTDAGVTWSPPVQLPATQFYEIGLDLQNPNRLYGGTQDNNTIRTNTGNLDDWDRILGGDGFYVIVDPTNPDIIYAESQFGFLAKSTNGGFTFNSALDGISASEPTNWSTPVAMDPNNNKVLYYGTNRLYKTTDGANSWKPVSASLTGYTPGSRLGTITTISAAPSNSSYIYVGTDDARVWVTKDAGATWELINSGLPDRWVTRVLPDPFDESIVYVTFSGLKWKDPQPHIFKSTDAGKNWTDISSNLPDAPINAVAVDYHNPLQIYAGTDVGAFVTTNGGTSWNILGSGLPSVSVYDLKIHPVENYLAAGTHGRSMYKLNLNPISDVKETLGDLTFNLSQNYPNPFNPSTTIKFSLPQEEFVNLEVYNNLGELAAVLLKDRMKQGNHEIDFNASGLSSGIYYYKLTAGSNSVTRKMVLIK